jgi:hypothetical protein
MDGTLVFLLATGVLLALAMLAMAHGVDSRDGMADEHARSVGG